MVINRDSGLGPYSEKFFITCKKVGLIEYFHSCYCSSGNSFEKAVQLEKELDRFDNEMRRRANERFEKEHPNGVQMLIGLTKADGIDDKRLKIKHNRMESI